MAKTLNDEYEGSNEQTTTYYYQDDESTRTHLSVLHDEAIPLFDGNATMEEVDNNDIHHRVNNFPDEHFINEIDDDVIEDINEFIYDEELYNLDSSDDGSNSGVAFADGSEHSSCTILIINGGRALFNSLRLDISFMRNKVKKTANSTEYEDLRSHEPRGMKDEIWNELIDIWKTLEWKKSDAGRKNRVAHHNAMVHTGGSRSFGQHKRIMESYEVSMTHKYGEDTSTHPVINYDLWLKATGENKKKKVCGLGPSLDLCTAIISTHASSKAIPSSTTPAPLTKERVIDIINDAFNFFLQTLPQMMQHAV
ncbi:hypothetical protein JHK87_000437 [Glycine soja]|nr:hypothetical protein JHK87_000437 [Glycine soja]